MTWEKPSFLVEFGEFLRVSRTFKIPLWKLFLFFLTGKMTELTDKDWSTMENTDSWETTTLELVRYHSDHTGRDVKRILSALSDPHGQLPTPIVLRLPDGQSHLVAGNTRLMVCRAQKVLPTVLLIGHRTPVE